MKQKKEMGMKEGELNGMVGGDRKTEPALRCQLTPQIHSNPPPMPTLFANTSSALVCSTLKDLQTIRDSMLVLPEPYVLLTF